MEAAAWQQITANTAIAKISVIQIKGLNYPAGTVWTTGRGRQTHMDEQASGCPNSFFFLKTRAWEEFGKVTENDFQTASKKVLDHRPVTFSIPPLSREEAGPGDSGTGPHDS